MNITSAADASIHAVSPEFTFTVPPSNGAVGLSVDFYGRDVAGPFPDGFRHVNSDGRSEQTAGAQPGSVVVNGARGSPPGLTGRGARLGGFASAPELEFLGPGVGRGAKLADQWPV